MWLEKTILVAVAVVLIAHSVIFARFLYKDRYGFKIPAGTPIYMEPKEDATVYYVIESEEIVLPRKKDVMPGWLRLAKNKGFVRARDVAEPNFMAEMRKMMAKEKKEE